MSASRHERAGALFLEAREMSRDLRVAFLADACGDDDALRCEVESLLAGDDEDLDLEPVAMLDVRGPLRDTSDAPEAPPAGDGADADAGADGADGARGPARIGQYRILGRLGVGGMGVVYLAEQSHPRRRVALKVIRAGCSSPRLIRRFLNEAQMLGQLQHPGIAQIHESGQFDDGEGAQPFFAMEYVEGVPLNQAIERDHLDLRRRLELLAVICDAVHSAHEQGVIHRDLKPANILVQANGQPKILDFGVARATDAEMRVTTLQTDVGQLVGTIPYMSPEQVAGKGEIDRRSDVYALGVICYESLAGRLPHELGDASIPEALRMIREDEPSRLSSVSTVYRGDIETIVAKALEKDRDHRYASAAELAGDLRRYLEQRPIVARPPGTVYRAMKFARRNKALVGGTVATILAVAAGLVGTTRFALGERREAARTAAVNTFLLDMLEGANPALNPDGREMTVAEMLDAAAAKVDATLAGQPRSEAAVRYAIGQAYRMLARFPEAISNMERVVELHRGLGEDAEEAEALIELAAALNSAADLDAAEARAREALAIDLRLFGEAHRRVVNDWSTLGAILQQKGDLRAATEPLERALAVGDRILAPDDEMRAKTRRDLGVLLFFLGDYERTERLFREAVELRRRIQGEDHPMFAADLINLGVVLRNMGRLDDAEAVYREAAPVVDRVYGPDHQQSATLVNNFARLLQERGRLEEAREMFAECMARRRRLLGDDHPEVNLARRNVAAVDVKLGAYERAEEALRVSLAYDLEKFGPDHEYTQSSRTELAAALMGQERYTEAEPEYAKVVESLRRSREPGHVHIAWNLVRHANCLMRMEREDDAAERLLEAYEIYAAAADADVDVEKWNTCVRLLAEIEDARGNAAAASRWQGLAREAAP